LRIVSEIALPELAYEEYDLQQDQIQKGSEFDKIEIQKVDLTESWNRLGFIDSDYAGNKEEVYFRIKNVAIFCVQYGRKISVSPFPGADENQIRLYVLGTCLGTLLMQRKILPLHGSAVVINEEAYAIVGDSGAGKSTLAAAFLEKGYQLLSDDVIAVTGTSDSDKPVVYPSYPQQKLWQESLDQLKMDASQYQPLYMETNKYAIPVRSQFCAKSLPLVGIIELVKTEQESAVMRQLHSLDALLLLNKHTYRQFLIPILHAEHWHFAYTASLASQTKMFRLERPNSGFPASELAALILNTVHKEC